MKVIVDVEAFEEYILHFTWTDFIDDSVKNVQLNSVVDFLKEQPKYKELADNNLPESKHPNYKQFIGAYKTYHEQILKRPFKKLNAGDGKSMNAIIDQLLKHTNGEHQKALEGWVHILTEAHKLNEFLISQTERLTSFDKYLNEIIRKTTKNEVSNNNKRGGKYAQ